MSSNSDPVPTSTWAEFDEFWEALESSHAETPYTFDAYDEEVARIAFKAGRESMRRHLAALLEHRLAATRGAGWSRVSAAEVDRGVLQVLVDDVDALVRAEDN